VGVVGFVVVWWVAGFEIAILAGAAVVAAELLLRYFSDGSAEDGATAPEAPPPAPAMPHHEQ
jgi:hypothetical protein